MNAAEELALAERVVSAMMAKDAFSQWLGIEVLEVQPRAVAVRLTVRADMLNGFGSCHGGVTFALADTALAFASNTHGRVTVSIDNGISYPRRVAEGDVLTAVAAETTATNRLAFYDVRVCRDDELVATFRGTVFRTDQAFFSETE